MRFDFGRKRIGQDDIFARVGGIFAAVCVRSILVLRRVAAQMETRFARFVLSSNAVFIFGRRAGERALRLVAARRSADGGGYASALGAGVGGGGELGGARRAAAVGRRGAAGGVGASASGGAAVIFVGRADGAFGRGGSGGGARLGARLGGGRRIGDYRHARRRPGHAGDKMAHNRRRTRARVIRSPFGFFARLNAKTLFALCARVLIEPVL